MASEPLIHFMHNIFRQAPFTYSDNRGESVSKCSEGAPTNEWKRWQAIGLKGNRLQKCLSNPYFAAFSVSGTAIRLQTLPSPNHFFVPILQVNDRLLARFFVNPAILRHEAR